MTGIKTLRVTELVLEITCDLMVYIVLDSSNFRALVLAEVELYIAFPMIWCTLTLYTLPESS